MLRYFDKPHYLAPLNESSEETDFSTLTDRKTIRNIAKKICNDLHHPVTIFDINRIDDDLTDNVRIDSDIEYFSLRNSCRLLRHCGSEEKCHECDKYHAQILKDYSIHKKLHYKDCPSFFYDGYIDNPPIVLEDFNRPVLEYHCPMLGYRELLFPIYYEQDLIGVLFVGQTIIDSEGDKEKVRNIVEKFFTKEENKSAKLFAEFAINNKLDLSITTDEIERLIKDADSITESIENYFRLSKSPKNNSFEQVTMTFADKEKYYSFINSVCLELTKVESDLSAIVNSKKEKYFKKLTEKIVEQYFESLNVDCYDCESKTNTFLQRSIELKNAWKEFISATEKLKKELGIKEIYLFGDGTTLKMGTNNKKFLYSPTFKDTNINQSCFYDFSKIENNKIKIHDFISSLKEPSVFEGLNVCFDIENFILLLFSDIAILLEVKDISDNKEIYTKIADAIGSSFIKIHFYIALCTSNLMKERHVLTLRMNRHESTHISTRLSDNMKRYFGKKGRAFFEIDQEKRELVVDDMYNTIQLISHMASNIGIIMDSINVDTIRGNKQKLDVFDMLYKWQIMFREKLLDRNLDFVIQRETDEKVSSYFVDNFIDAPRNIVINSELFELLVYNLVDNAVKYAYCGSTIYLRWCYTDDKTNNYKFSITSFGPEIKKEYKIYDLYARGDLVRQHTADGDGIGLYVVRKIEKLLGLTVTDNCIPVSKYNLPLIQWYIKEPFKDVEHNLKQQILSNYYNQEKVKTWDFALNTNHYSEIKRRDLSQEYLDARIDRETWMSTFEVIVPQSFKNNEL